MVTDPDFDRRDDAASNPGVPDAAVLGLPCPLSRRHLGRDRALGTSPEVGRCGTS